MPVSHELTTVPLLLFLSGFGWLCVVCWKRGIAAAPPPATPDE